MHKATDRFWQLYEKLPGQIKSVADEKFELLKSNPQHPSLHFKKVGNFWSVRIGLNYRALAVKFEHDYIWVWIGNHEEYENLI